EQHPGGRDGGSRPGGGGGTGGLGSSPPAPLHDKRGEGRKQRELQDHYDSAEGGAAFDVGVGVGGFGEGECAVDDGLQFPLVGVGDEGFDHLAGAVRAGGEFGAEEDAGEGGVLL